MHRHRGIHHRAGRAAAARAPHHAGEPQLRDAERDLDLHRLVPLGGMRAEPVDLLHVDPGVVGGLADRLAAQRELGAVGDAAVARVFGLADADDRGAVREGRTRGVTGCGNGAVMRSPAD